MRHTTKLHKSELLVARMIRVGKHEFWNWPLWRRRQFIAGLAMIDRAFEGKKFANHK